MKNLFECKVSYYEEGAEKSIVKVFLVDAFTFTECESNITTYMTEWVDIADFDIISMTRKSFSDIVFREEQAEYSWYESKIKMVIDDAGKEKGFTYIVADKSVKDATIQMNEYLEDSDGETRVTSVKYQPIADIILRKECCKECNICDSTVRVLSFDEQKSLDAKFSEIDEARAKLMEELGAISLSMNKYKIKVSRESLEKVRGEILGGRILRAWTEDFIDEDTSEIVSIERNEVIIESGTIIDDYEIEEILSSGQEIISIRR